MLKWTLYELRCFVLHFKFCPRLPPLWQMVSSGNSSCQPEMCQGLNLFRPQQKEKRTKIFSNISFKRKLSFTDRKHFNTNIHLWLFLRVAKRFPVSNAGGKGDGVRDERLLSETTEQVALRTNGVNCHLEMKLFKRSFGFSQSAFLFW